MSQQNVENDQLFDYDVIDSNGQRIGAVDNVWADPTTGAPLYLGAKTGMLGGTYVLPVAAAQYDHARRLVQLPFHAEYIKHAPSLSSQAELTALDERKLETYYGPFVSGAGIPGAGMARAAATAAGAAATGQSAMNAAGNRTAEGYDNAKADVRGAVNRADNAVHGRPPVTVQDQAAMSSQVGQESTQSVPGSQVQLRKVVRKERVYVPVDVEREYVVQEPGGAATQPMNQPMNQSTGNSQASAPVDATASAAASDPGDREVRREEARELERRSDAAEDNANRGTTVPVERPRR